MTTRNFEYVRLRMQQMLDLEQDWCDGYDRNGDYKYGGPISPLAYAKANQFIDTLTDLGCPQVPITFPNPGDMDDKFSGIEMEWDVNFKRPDGMFNKIADGMLVCFADTGDIDCVYVRSPDWPRGGLPTIFDTNMDLKTFDVAEAARWVMHKFSLGEL